MARAGPAERAAGLPLVDANDASRLGPQYRPGTRLLVTFAEDPGYWHERLVLYPASLRSWAIMTPHGDEYVEHEDWWTSVALMTGRVGYPREARGDIIQFESPVEIAELMVAIRRGRELALRARSAAGRRSPASAHRGRDLGGPRRGDS